MTSLSSSHKKEEVEEIFNLFIRNDGEYALNLPEKITMEVYQKFRSGNLDPSIFDSALKNIQTLMEK